MLKGVEITITDINQNQYYLSKGIVDLSTNELLGKEVKVSLRNDTFGNPKTNQDLLVDQLFMDLKTKIKGVFTSCGTNDNCPPCQLNQMK